MRTVYRAENLIDAHLVKDALEREGIPAFVAGEYLVGGVGELPARDLVSVMVPDGAVEPARRCVSQVEKMLAAPGPLSADDDDEAGDVAGVGVAPA